MLLEVAGGIQSRKIKTLDGFRTTCKTKKGATRGLRRRARWKLSDRKRQSLRVSWLPLNQVLKSTTVRKPRQQKIMDINSARACHWYIAVISQRERCEICFRTSEAQECRDK